MAYSKCYIGTEIKLNISVDPIGNTTMDSYNFVVDVFCSPSNIVTLSKKEANRVDSNNYTVIVDSTALGVGKVKVKLTAEIPDTTASDGYRTEVVVVDTGINIVKAY